MAVWVGNGLYPFSLFLSIPVSQINSTLFPFALAEQQQEEAVEKKYILFQQQQLAEILLNGRRQQLYLKCCSSSQFATSWLAGDSQRMPNLAGAPPNKRKIEQASVCKLSALFLRLLLQQ
uniref:Uncharacterized protein n=1 Tax=Ditylenchus dipsaci TaxID=166011 RepID=A0A915E9T1_9BILA